MHAYPRLAARVPEPALAQARMHHRARACGCVRKSAHDSARMLARACTYVSPCCLPAIASAAAIANSKRIKSAPALRPLCFHRKGRCKQDGRLQFCCGMRNRGKASRSDARVPGVWRMPLRQREMRKCSIICNMCWKGRVLMRW